MRSKIKDANGSFCFSFCLCQNYQKKLFRGVFPAGTITKSYFLYNYFSFLLLFPEYRERNGMKLPKQSPAMTGNLTSRRVHYIDFQHCNANCLNTCLSDDCISKCTTSEGLHAACLIKCNSNPIFCMTNCCY